MRSFTLIETLAIVVLLAMVASIGAVGLSGTNDIARVREALAVIEATDADARTIARSQGHAMVSLSRDRSTIVIESGDDRILIRPLPKRVRAHLVAAESDQPIHTIRFDPAGRTRDYTVILELGGQRSSIRIAGLTGWVTQP